MADEEDTELRLAGNDGGDDPNLFQGQYVDPNSDPKDDPLWREQIERWAGGEPDDFDWLQELFAHTHFFLLEHLAKMVLETASDCEISLETSSRAERRNDEALTEARKITGEDDPEGSALALDLRGWISCSDSIPAFHHTLAQLLVRLPIEDLRAGIVNRRPKDATEVQEVVREQDTIIAAQKVAATPEGGARYVAKEKDDLPHGLRNQFRGKLENVFRPLHYARMTSEQLDAVQGLEAQFPNAANALQTIHRNLRRRYQFGDDRIHLRPTILVGEAGTGKTRLCRELARILDVHVAVGTVAGHNDAHIFGVSAGYNSAFPSIMTTAVADAGVMNPLVMIDEIDKVRPGHNGDVWAEFLGLLEPVEAGTYYERFVSSNVDASGISWIFTANDLGPIPRTFLSRCAVCEIPPPVADQIRTIIRNMVVEYARDLEIDERFLVITPEDIEYLEGSWSRHRSIRCLSELVKLLLDERQQDLGHA
ncbi:AAA family ATPase [Tropicimonas sp. TH_r6]|uniref:AAA family ATPase n=1 Tax=Tropicimonas sp. TH_r6 TaxID=3082085 RepID=UPI002954272A|nr:AAA family ATPase [Tropicimonas sp. TH_r6]MDV7144752.1 AAA family ATPase [Tropicimonas sp. TH_r6]